MKKVLKVLGLSLTGSVTGWIIWLGVYLVHKTPAIEFDGPAFIAMIGSVITGMLIFTIVGIILVKTKRF